jgi:ribosomal protein L7Ae-like RNA K-turn-binding protein
MADRIYSFLGLATRAQKLLSGEETCDRALKAGRVNLIIVSEDASQNTKKKFFDACKYRNINIRVFGKKEFLGKFTGKNVRSVIAILDKEFSKRLIEMIDSDNTRCGGEYIVKD